MKRYILIAAFLLQMIPCVAQSGDGAEFNLNRFLNDSNRRFSPDNNTRISAKIAIYCHFVLEPCEILIWDYQQTKGTGLVQVDVQTVRLDGKIVKLGEPLAQAEDFRLRRGTLPDGLIPRNGDPLPARFYLVVRISGLGIQAKRHKLMFPLGIFPYSHQAHPMVLDLVWDGEELKTL